jgi:diguanylate cyclase (GGDEF)-like protein
MEKSFIRSNLSELKRANLMVFVLSLCFSIFPLFVENAFDKAFVYFSVSALALFMFFVAKHKHNRFKDRDTETSSFIRMWIVLFYINIMFLGIYLGAINNPIGIAGTFLGFLIVALFMFVNPPLFNLCLTLIALAAFYTASIYFKESKYWTYDIANGALAAIVGLYFGWHINRYRVSIAINSLRLEEERNKYYDQSKIDELTQLRNRRDFEFTFKRRLTNYRYPDDVLCVAVIDIDCFKNYNDFYGHPQGDECLRAVGKALIKLSAGTNIYAARIGGEEFCLLWFNSEQVKAEDVVLRVFKAIEDLAIPHEKTTVEGMSRITVSIGVYVVECESSNDTKEIYKFADDALYEAKRNGRNCAFIGGKKYERYKIIAGK